jgi:hypothetical protein
MRGEPKGSALISFELAWETLGERCKTQGEYTKKAGILLPAF